MDITREDALKELAVRELQRRGAVANSPSGADFAMSGPMLNRGVDAAVKGFSGGDVLPVVAKTVSGFLQNAPQNVMARPMLAAAGGLPAVQAGSSGIPFLPPNAPIEKNNFLSSFPKPVSQGGQQAGNDLGFAASLVPMIEGLQGLLKPAKAAMAETSLARATSKAPEFAGHVRDSMFGLREKLGSELDASISKLSNENPTKTIDLSPTMQRVSDAINDPANPGLKSDIMRTIRKTKNPDVVGKLQTFIADPSQAENLTLRDAEDIKRAVQQGVKFGDRSPGDLEMNDMLHEIKLAQAEQFPQLSEIRKPYSDFMDAFRKVKGMFGEKVLEKNIKGKFGVGEVENLVSKVIPHDVLQKIGGVRNAVKMLGAMKSFGKYAGMTGAGTAAVAGAGKLLGVGKPIEVLGD